MAYDNFENTPFDLNHDGHIDANEAAYIHDTFYSESDSSDDDDMDFSIQGGYRTNNSSRKNKEIDHEKLMQDVRRADMNRTLIAFGILIVASIVFSDSPGIVLFLGGMMLSAKISGVF